jgi:hypothetical protein
MNWPLSRVGDLIAIPLFFLLSLYFYKKSKEQLLTTEEKILFLFAVGGFVADVFFVFLL